MARTHSSSTRRAAHALAALSLLLSSVVTARTQTQTPSAFTYQGRLTDAGAPANGAFDFEFKLFDGSGAPLGSAQAREDVVVTNGVFLVRLDFGASPFVPGAPASTLEIGVRPGVSTGAFTTLAPRQPITATPYAVQTINAEMLGGVPASQYVKTDDPRLTDGGPPAPGSDNYVQNTTTQQPGVSFNIGGNGLFGGQVGIGTQTPLPGKKLDVNGPARISPGGSGGAVEFGPAGGETGMAIIGTNRADVRFDGTSLKLVAGVGTGAPGSANGLNVYTTGDVTVGQAGFIGKLNVVADEAKPGIYAQSPNRAVWGETTGGSYGVYGQSLNGTGIGVQGVSASNIGVGGISESNVAVAGTSTSSIGVRGQTAATSIASPGVQGVSTGTGGVGVRGDGTTGVFGMSATNGGVGVTGQANSGNSIGVFGTTTGGTGVRGESTGATGYGLYAKNPSGMALGVEGNAAQQFDKGGLVKAMIYVRADGTIARCFNSQLPDGGASLPPSGSAGCGLTVSPSDSGSGTAFVSVGFNFNAGDRFWSAAVVTTTTENVGVKTAGSGSSISVRIYLTDQRLFTDVFRDFILIVY